MATEESLTPGSAEWYRTISASKVAAIMGLSPWQSRFSLWHIMAGNIDPDPGSKATERGTFLEAAVLAWFSETTGRKVTKGRMYRHPDHDDWTATPDAIIDGGEEDGAAVEVKTAQYADDWGEPGTAEIPVYYLVQVAWQMIVTGARIVYIPVLFGAPFEFRLYVVRWADIQHMVDGIRASVTEFQASLAANDAPPLDGSTATYQTVRKLHPEIDGEVVELPATLAVDFIEATTALEIHAERAQLAKTAVADYMGTAKKAVWDKRPIATRQARNGGTPYLVAARNLPTPERTAQ